MKQLHLKDLPDNADGHFLKGLIPGQYLCQGGIVYKKPNQRTHDTGCTCPACDGQGRHVHTDDREAFIILQGKAVMQCDGKEYPLTTGDIFIAEPGEDHHLVADNDEPCINLWLHAGDTPHPDQQ
jgi:mannose-6-phosphate isomerase-like protein (cupin superfamily)